MASPSHCGVTIVVNVSWSDLSKPVEYVAGGPGMTLDQVLKQTETGRNLVEQLNFQIAEGTPGIGVRQHGICVQTTLEQLLTCTVEVFIGIVKQCTLKIAC